MKIWQDEIFAPVLSVVRVQDLDEGIELANQSKFANGAVIYTSSGKSAQQFRDKIDAGMIGVNVNVPAPMAFFSFAGNKASFYGDLGTNGKDGVQFYTRKKGRHRTLVLILNIRLPLMRNRFFRGAFSISTGRDPY